MKFLLMLSAVRFSANAQPTDADYQRANGLREKLQGLAVNLPGTPTWIDSTRFVYRKAGERLQGNRAAELGRLGRKFLHLRVDRMVAGFEVPCRVSRKARLQTRGALC
jgi:hypothetical protein